MAEVLDRDDETTTVSGDYRWTPAVDAFTDATPVTRPMMPAPSYDLLSSIFRRRLFKSWAASTQEQAIRLAIPSYLVTLSGDAQVEIAGRPVAIALFGKNADDEHAEADKDVEGGVAQLVPNTDSKSAEHPGTVALRELQAWTGLGLDAIVSLAGLAPSTRAYWRNNPSAPVRPTKSGRLLRLHSVIGLLVGEVGVREARLILGGEGWLAETLDDSRLGELELRVRHVLLPDGLEPPTHLRSRALSREELLARALGDDDDAAAEDARREAESSATSYLRGDGAPEET